MESEKSKDKASTMRNAVKETANQLILESHYCGVDLAWTGRIKPEVIEEGCKQSQMKLESFGIDGMEQTIAEFYVSGEPLIEYLSEPERSCGRDIQKVLFDVIARESQYLPGTGTIATVKQEAYLKLWWDETRHAMGVKMRFSGVRS